MDFNYRLRLAPIEVKIMIAGFLLALGLAYIYALGNIALVIGWTPQDIATHYYGAPQAIAADQPAATGEAEFSLDDVAAEPAPAPLIRPSFKNLVQEGHFHLFGMTSFFFGLTFLGLFTSVRRKLKLFLVGVPYVAIIFDNVSFMATRFLGPAFAYLTAVSGAFMGICFTALWFVIAAEIFKSGDSK